MLKKLISLKRRDESWTKYITRIYEAFPRDENESWTKYGTRAYRTLRIRQLASKKKVGREELRELKSVIRSGDLAQGVKIQQFSKQFAHIFGVRHAITSTSGTAAIHVATSMINPDPGDEIIVPPITDVGTIIPILYQNAIPVFADVQADTWIIDPKSIEKNITPKTKAIIVVHFFGNPCDMQAILGIAQKYGIAIIEDCAQAALAEYRGRLVGTIGDIGCFSFQHHKYITTGEGGMTITNNTNYGTRGMLFVDKGWSRADADMRRYTMLGINYRMTELQAAVGIAQLRKLKDITNRLNKNGTILTEKIQEIDGISPQYVEEGNKHTYWKYGFTINPDAPFTADAFVRALKQEGITATAHYLSAPIFVGHAALQKKQLYGNSHFPFDYPTARQDITYGKGVCPVAEEVLQRLVSLNMSPYFSENHINTIAEAIKKVTKKLTRNRNISGFHTTKNAKYRAGIIGCGERARWHAEAYQSHSDVTVTAIADKSSEALKTIASAFAVSNCYTDYHEMLSAEQLDIISICTWPQLHAPMTIAAAECGAKAILCEKPMAMTLSEADAMIQACEENGVKLIIGHQYRFNPYFTEAKRLIESGSIGEVLYVWGHSSDSLMNKGPHLVDTMRYILSDPKTEWVLGQIERKKDSYNRGHLVEEVAGGLVQFSNGARGFIEMGYLAIQDVGLHVYGSEGQLDVTEHTLRVHDVKHKGWRPIYPSSGVSDKLYTTQVPELMSLQVSELIAWLNGEIKDFRGNAYHGRMTLEIILAIFESVRTHGVVYPPFTITEAPLDVMVKAGNL